MPGWKNALPPKLLNVKRDTGQYFVMAITKVGANLLRGLARAGYALGAQAMRYGFPAVSTALAANDIASGQRSAGQAIGEAAGGAAGFWGMHRLTSGITGKVRLPYLGSAANFVVPALASFYAADKGSEVLGKIMPWRRSPITVGNYLSHRGPGEHGSP